MTTNAGILDLAMARLGSRRSPAVRSNLLNEINASILTLERGAFFPWFLQNTASLVVSADLTFAALPSDFALEQEDTRPYYTLEGTVYYLTKRLYAVLQGETPTTVKYYAIQGSTLHFRKATEQQLTITLLYYAKTDAGVLDNSTEASNLWLLNARDWVLAMALKNVAALHLKDMELAAGFSGMEQQAKRELYIYHESRVHQNQDYEVGGSSDGT